MRAPAKARKFCRPHYAMPPGLVEPNCAVVMGLHEAVFNLYPVATTNYARLVNASSADPPAAVMSIAVRAPRVIIVPPHSHVEFDSLVTVLAFDEGTGDFLGNASKIRDIQRTVPLRASGVVFDGTALDVRVFNYAVPPPGLSNLWLQIVNGGSSTLMVPLHDPVCTLTPATFARVAMVPIGVGTNTPAWDRFGGNLSSGPGFYSVDSLPVAVAD